MEKTKESLYTVIKNADVNDSLSETEKQILNLLMLKITKNKPSRKYYVVNKDEPYAHKVLETILDGEESKKGDFQVTVLNLLKANLKGNYHANPYEDGEVMPINFSFNSYPLTDKLEIEFQAALGEIQQQLIALGIENYSWRLATLDRFRDTFSFSDIYIGVIHVRGENEKRD